MSFCSPHIKIILEQILLRRYGYQSHVLTHLSFLEAPWRSWWMGVILLNVSAKGSYPRQYLLVGLCLSLGALVVSKMRNSDGVMHFCDCRTWVSICAWPLPKIKWPLVKSGLKRGWILPRLWFLGRCLTFASSICYWFDCLVPGGLPPRQYLLSRAEIYPWVAQKWRMFAGPRKTFNSYTSVLIHLWLPPCIKSCLGGKSVNIWAVLRLQFYRKIVNI